MHEIKIFEGPGVTELEQPDFAMDAAEACVFHFVPQIAHDPVQDCLKCSKGFSINEVSGFSRQRYCRGRGHRGKTERRSLGFSTSLHSNGRPIKILLLRRVSQMQV